MAYTTRRFHPARFSSFRAQIIGVTSRIAILVLSVMLLAACPARVLAVTPDAVLEWIGIMDSTVIAGGTTPLATTRNVALVSASVFDAVNGIDPRFQALHVKPSAPHHASQSAAAIQAAYVILKDLYPKQMESLAAQRDASIAALSSKEKADSIKAGMAWGQTVADAIWNWRLTDGILPPPPPFLGAAVTGVWRPTPTMFRDTPCARMAMSETTTSRIRQGDKRG